MAHKKVHPAETKAPQTQGENTVNPPSAKPIPTQTGAGFQEQDAKRRQGAFEVKGEHARQQQMSNKD